MRYGSVSSGIECASIAFRPLGWQPEFLAEIDPFASTVLHHHHSSGRPRHMPSPDAEGLSDKERRARRAAIKAVASLPERANGVPNHGDMTTFEEWPDAAIDLLIGGTPCQSYSVAGLRKGLDDPRGDLTLTYAAIARRYRPRWLVWENVFGVLSHDKGRSFASLLGLLSGRRVEVPAGGWKSAGIVEGYERAYGLAWRVLDTQYVRVDGFGRALPQRRRRVFVVGYLGDWRRAAAVLLEREGLSGNPAPRRSPGKDVAGTTAESAGSGGRSSRRAPDRRAATQAFGGGRNCNPTDVSTAITAHPGGRYDLDLETFVCASPLTSNPYGDHESREGLLVAYTHRAHGFDASEDGTGRGTPITPIDMRQASRGETMTNNRAEGSSGGAPGTGIGEVGDPCPTLGTSHPPAIAFNSREDPEVTFDRTGPLGASSPQAQAIAFQERGREGGRSLEIGGDVAYALTSPSGGGRHQEGNILHGWTVRRLTPTECCRLQGVPDDYFDEVVWRGKIPPPDGPIYKTLGNGFSANAVRWIGRRIEMVEAIIVAEAAA